MLTDGKIPVIKSFTSLRSINFSWRTLYLQSFENCVGYSTFLEHHTEYVQICPLVTGKVDTHISLLDSVNLANNGFLSWPGQQSQCYRICNY